MRCYLFDLDGTLADCSHRLYLVEKEPRRWNEFFAQCGGDKPIRHMIEVARALSNHAAIVLVSGRSDEYRDMTLAWLRKHAANWNVLYMRKAGDDRPDQIVKSEMLDRILADGYEPIMAFDDRDCVVRMWRARGIPCAQVAPGDF